MANNNFELEVNKMVDESKEQPKSSNPFGYASREEYEQKQNERHDKARDLLKSKGYDVDAIKTSDDVFNLFDKIFEEWHKNPADKMPYQESNKVWERDYQPTFDALKDIEEKLYYDEYYAKYPERKKKW